MKTMKQISAAFLAVVMALSLAACGGAEKTVVLRGDLTDDVGIPTTDTWTLTAKGDIVQTVKEVVEYDFSSLDDTTKDITVSMFESTFVEPAKGVEGLTCTGRMSGDTYIIEITIDCTGNAAEKAADIGIIEFDSNDNSGKISLKLTQTSLEKQGYEIVE